MSQNISKCREGYKQGESAWLWAVARTRHMVGGPPRAVPPPCPGVAQRGAPGGLPLRTSQCRGGYWPGALSESPGEAAPRCAPAHLASSPQPWQPWQPWPGACIAAASSLDRRSQAWLEGSGSAQGRKPSPGPALPKNQGSLLPTLGPTVGPCPGRLLQLGPGGKWEGWGPGPSMAAGRLPI